VKKIKKENDMKHLKHLRLFILSLAVVTLFAGTVVSPSHAWWWSDYAKVTVPIQSTGMLMIDSVQCKSATLNKGYTKVTVNNYWLSNNCAFTFENVYVKTSGWYTITYKYTYLFSSKTKTASIYIAKPWWGDTYTTSTVKMAP
jgi:hypothetical protein